VTLEALTDGLYVAPVLETADYHASLNKNSWLYVFDYQTKYGDFMQVGWILLYFLIFYTFRPFKLLRIRNQVRQILKVCKPPKIL
jgi:hypothetical protein